MTDRPPPHGRLIALPTQGDNVSEQLGPVTIGAREIYDELRAVSGKVDQLGARVEHVAEAQTGTARLTAEDLTDHETRIRVLERARWPLPSIAALIGVASMAMAIVTFFTKTGG